MSVKDVQIIPFENNASGYIDELMRIDEECLNEYAAPWTEEQFMLPLPGKDRLSRLAVTDGRLAGYMVCSHDSETGHIHRMSVEPLQQNAGTGTLLLNAFIRECRELGLKRMSAETQTANPAAMNFYEKSGFRRLSGQELEDYLKKKNKAEQIDSYSVPDGVNTVFMLDVK